MCGLTGYASRSVPGDRGRLAASARTLFHRGPDDAGQWWSPDGRIGLGHQRLSILDTSDLGHQPMLLAERGLAVAFNGEIYNFAELRRELQGRGHSFRSECDTEVLLAAYAEWGTDCLPKLDGMFAFALYDSVQQRIFAARDRAGEKPFFYRLAGETLHFASELKALLAWPDMPRRIDPTSLDCYLTLGYVPGARCILAGYHKLPPAHALSFDVDRATLRTWRYWQPPDFDTVSRVDDGTLLDELEILLEDAVGRQLRADVPVGVLLSGGVDSSLVTAMAVRHSSDVHTFSIGFPGHGETDETAHARLIARHFGTNHTELMAEPATADLIPTLSRQFDEPVADSSMIPTYLVSRLVRERCTVALGGDGGDELFAGYLRYNRLLSMQRRLHSAHRYGGKAASRAAAAVMPIGMRGRNYLSALESDLNRELPVITTFFDARTRRRLMNSDARWPTPAEGVARQRTPRQTDLLQRATRFDFDNYLPEDILVKVDRASMLNSLEVRAPFLDRQLMEFAFGRVPSRLKATTTEKKILLKQLTERLLPANFDRQRKQGFTIPIADWLKGGPFRELFHDVLAAPDCTFDRKTVDRLIRGQQRGLVNGERLFALTHFELWRQAYRTHL